MSEAVSINQYIQDSFSSDFDEFDFEGDLEAVLGETPQRQENLFKHNSRLARRYRHYQEKKSELDKTVVQIELNNFLQDEYEIYLEEYGIGRTSVVRDYPIINEDGTETHMPSHNQRRVNFVNKFIEINGVCDEMLEGLDEVIDADYGRLGFLTVLRQAFEQHFKNNLVKQGE